MAKKHRKWYQNKLLITVCNLIGSTLLGFLVTYGFTIRNENININNEEENLNKAQKAKEEVEKANNM